MIHHLSFIISPARHSSLVTALLLLLASPAAHLAAGSSPYERAQAAYERAVAMQAALESHPEGARRRADYGKLIKSFQAVYRDDPSYRKVPAALAAVGGLYEEMARVFSNDDDYREAIKAYQLLIAQYPESSISRDALFTVGEIYRSALKDPAEARTVLQDFVKKYPRAAKAATARREVAEIDRAQGRRPAREPASSPGTSAAISENPEGQRRLIRPAEAGKLGTTVGPRPGHIPEVNTIHRWVGLDYTRIVIGVEDEVKFDASRVENPDRLVFDLYDTHLGAALAGQQFKVDDGFLREVRVAQYKPSVTRVVLDVKQIEDYSVFSLPNPFRLVIDIHGQPSRMPSSHASPPAVAASTPGVAATGRATDKAAPAPESHGANQAQAPSGAEIGARQRSLQPEAHATASGGVNTGSKPVDLVTKASRSNAQPLPPTNSSTPGRDPDTSGQASRAPASAPEPQATSRLTPREVESSVAAPTAGGSRTLTRALGLKIARIVIDPGHGGHDTGTIGPSGLCEKDLVLDVGLRLQKLVQRKMGSEVVMTRSDDTFIPLEERTALANQMDADLFISIHANASRDPRARGIETYYLNFTTSPEALEVAARENATSQESVHKLQSLIEKIALTEKVEESREFARHVQRSVYAQIAQTGAAKRDRGLKKAPFVVLIGANMPSILAEISFLTNPQDERQLKKPAYRQKMAEALYRGIASYVNNLGGVKVAQRSPVRSQEPEARSQE